MCGDQPYPAERQLTDAAFPHAGTNPSTPPSQVAAFPTPGMNRQQRGSYPAERAGMTRATKILGVVPHARG